MNKPVDKKQFALAQMYPYYANPRSCGADGENSTCKYLTSDGRMCVVGKNLMYPYQFQNVSTGIVSLLTTHGFMQHELFKPEARGILTALEWGFLQMIHDDLARGARLLDIRVSIESHEHKLFSLAELHNYKPNE